VAILGGGVAALTAAMELSRPGWHERFDGITVYQLGWRLGGKGASGRGPHGRIEEHGLHLWLGFYENAFRVLQRACAEVGRDWRPMFEKASFVVLEDWHDGRWLHWPIMHAENDRVPGVPDDEDGPESLWDYARRALDLMVALAGASPPAAPAPAGWRRGVLAPVDRLVREVRDGLGTSAAAALTMAAGLARALDDDAAAHDRGYHELLVDLVDRFLRWYRDRDGRDDRVRRIGDVLDLIAAHLRGAVRDGLFTAPEGLARIDGEDYVAWLRRHGASEAAVRSPIVRGFYDTAFAYRHGDPARPAVAAGQALRGLLRFTFRYKGAIFWRMTAGMGDVVIAPLYQALRRRGVRFEFFHRVRSLHPAADGRSIATVRVGRQVRLVRPDAEYDPLIDVGGLPCWPAEPRYEQIAGGEALRGHNLESVWDPWPDVEERLLTAGRDFDLLVFGISLGAVPMVCPELLAASPRWREMVEHVETVQTQAFQLWLSAPVEALGWPWPQATVGSYVEPFDTWADMRQVLHHESWPAAGAPRAVAYFCNVLPTPPGGVPADPAYPTRMHETVRANAVAFLRRDMAHLWPRCLDPATGDFRWDLLAGAAGAGEARFASQFWRANVEPSDRYVLSLPGTDRYRLRPDGTGYDNLYVVGDWVDCGFNLGCVEAAVMSGMLAAHAIQGLPALDEIVGYRRP
jgi:uncharacterized protein with NAD-binding domain and iron-sulfur cluster